MSFFKLLDKAKKNCNGFTLVELIVTLAIFSIVLVVAGNYLFFGNNLFVKTEVKNSEKYIGDNVFEYMRRRITYATDVEVINPESSRTPKYDFVFKLNNDGQLLEGPKDGNLTSVFGPEFYEGGYKVRYEVQVLDSAHMELKVNVLAQGNDSPVYTTSEVLKVINLQKNGSILTTEGEQKKTYVNPVISYSEEKEIASGYNPIYLKEWMVHAAELLMDGETPNGEEPDEFRKMVGLEDGVDIKKSRNEEISSYVVQYYYKVDPRLGSSAQTELHPYWEDFPVEVFKEDVIQRVDAKVLEITGDQKPGSQNDQTLSRYFEKYKGNLKVRAHIKLNRSTKKTSCIIYVNPEANQPWSTRLVYCDVDGEAGWYYLAALKGKETNGAIGQKYQVAQRVWRADDGVPDDGKTPVYDEITNKAGSKQEGTWVKIE